MKKILTILQLCFLAIVIAVLGPLNVSAQQVGGNGGGCGGVTIGGNGACSGTNQNPGYNGIYWGAFLRGGGNSPYAAGTPGASSAPSPYPTFVGTPGNTASINNYCYAPDSNGNSIDSNAPLDKNKLDNIYDLGLTWVRQTDAPYFFDTSQLFGQSSVSINGLTQIAAIDCELHNHGVVAVTGVEMGPVQYNDTIGGFTGITHDVYDTPGAFANYCTAVAQLEGGVFGNHQYSIPGNEGNTGLTYGAGDQGYVSGAPDRPIPIPTSVAGTLGVGTNYQYRVTAIVNGVETLPSSEYYNVVPATTGHQSMRITWGPYANATSYNIYGRTAGSELKLASVATTQTITVNGQTFIYYTDTNGTLPSGALPTTSTNSVAAFEGEYVSMMKPCYQAIKAADPLAYVWGLELNITASLNPNSIQFVSDLKNNFACGPGTCYDGMSVHMYEQYPVPTRGGGCTAVSGSNGYGLDCLDAVETAAGGNIPLMIGETSVTVGGSGEVSTEALGVTALTANMQNLASYPLVKYVSYANIDECSEYGSGYFYDGCLVGGASGSTNDKQLRWFAAFNIFNANP